ncbi:L-aspartate oxidase [Mesobacillus harenae]|uniref:L-aspartate oxidase n=1 Tax=Mesobacillus harenae TaxID=2213203 RepID=UPI0015805258|nr:L-aspartate oxidase [Mesobacillus harenae]
MTYTDVLIIGSGVAALQLARLIRQEKNVRVLTKSNIKNANSYLAQGGIAAALSSEDHPEKHAADTLEAGRYQNEVSAVYQIIHEAPHLIQRLADEGCAFDRDGEKRLLLGLEGAHCEKRIIHGGGDATGKHMVDFLLSQLRSNVATEEDVFVYEILLDAKGQCIGVKGKAPDGSIHTYYADHIVLATGGCGQLYTYSSNAKTVTGDGIAMAYLAGAEIIDMEFIQFHPTLLYVNGETRGLISEAVRGEGGILINQYGHPIMAGVHPYKDLAPRHVVAQTIYDYLHNEDDVFLDISMIKDFEGRFPSISAMCKANGIQLEYGKIPVAPGSHFLMGGVKTDLAGRTSIPGLYVIGEAACTGLHGANRLASNSLLEGIYQGKALAEHINAQQRLQRDQQIVMNANFTTMSGLNLPDITQLQNSMMERVGIVRTKTLLEQQLSWIRQFDLEQKSFDSYSTKDITKAFMGILSGLITQSALERTESRGGHFRSDYPLEDDQAWLKKRILYQRKRGEQSEYTKIAVAT